MADDGQAAFVVCRICLESDDELLPGQVCACRGSCGAHMDCLIACAKHAWPKLDNWICCGTCKMQYVGEAKLGLARALWNKLSSRPEHDPQRLYAASNLTSTLYTQGLHGEAVALVK